MYGKSIHFDLSNCNLNKMTKEHIKVYLKELCKRIDMERVRCHWWTDEGISKSEWDSNPHLQGISVCQFIKTSAITIHAITGLSCVYVDLFSCKDFSVDTVEQYTIDFFEGKLMTSSCLKRS